ncbi:MAG TPA: magnesium transporter [Gemmatimonadales bacterium]|nr:magnesium transporter [Gemmatimonadales bacterium]
MRISTSSSAMDSAALTDAWPILTPEERMEGFTLLGRVDAEEFFLSLGARDQVTILEAMQPGERRSWMRLLAPDDAADVLQEAPDELRTELLNTLDTPTRLEVSALLAYAEDEAGGLMNPRYLRVRPEMTVDEALLYIRKQAVQGIQIVNYAYALDPQSRLQGVVSSRELFVSPSDKQVREIMHTDIHTVHEDTDQEAVAKLLEEQSLEAIPVVDNEGRMKGIITVDDIVDVIQEEATEDIQKMGGTAALDAPYLDVGFGTMIRKRGGWLAVLFLGEMLTATAMGFFEKEIQRAVVLALFVPLIISSGGNSGSQATTLVIRAMALGEVRLRDWWRVVRRELPAGLTLGTILGCIGVLRILLWQAIWGMYGEHYLLVAITVGLSLVGVVTFGTFAGSMLPFLFRRVGWDPASASAPFVATLVDVTGLIIYFTIASILLSGTLL